MSLDELIILPTVDTPAIIMRPGEIIIKGRSVKIIDPVSFGKIESWVNSYIADPADITTVNVYLEYLNTGNLLYYLNILRKFITIKSKGRELVINWYHDKEDEDIIDKGEYLASLLDIKFNFILIPGL